MEFKSVWFVVRFRIFWAGILLSKKLEQDNRMGCMREESSPIDNLDV